MHRIALAATLSFGIVAAAFGDEPVAVPAPAAAPAAQPAAGVETPQVPRTHVDTTVVGDSIPENATSAGAVAAAPAPLDNDHDFVAGAPEITKILGQLHLSPKQELQVKDAIQRSDAGAAILIKREHSVRSMIAATTPENPTYATLIREQAAGESRWTENRAGMRRDVLDLLTPTQRTRFEELEARQRP